MPSGVGAKARPESVSGKGRQGSRGRPPGSGVFFATGNQRFPTAKKPFPSATFLPAQKRGWRRHWSADLTATTGSHSS